jgi:hypothetical protein
MFWEVPREVLQGCAKLKKFPRPKYWPIDKWTYFSYKTHEGMQMGARMHSYQDVMVQLALVLQPPFLSQLEVAELSLVGSAP